MPKPTPVSGLGSETPLVEAAARLVGARVADVRRYEEKVRASRDEDAVHDMRVASRRLRVALWLLAKGQLDEAAEATKRLQDALGAVRDVHVQVGWLDGWRRDNEGSQGSQEDAAKSALKTSVSSAALASITDEERGKLPAREQALLAELDRWSSEAAGPIMARLGQLEGHGTLGAGSTVSSVRKLLRRVERGVELTLQSPDAHTAHQLRIAVKKLRYAVELVEAVAPRTMAILESAIEPLQESLGALHDADVRIALLEDFARRSPPELREGALHVVKEVEAERDKMGARLVVELEGVRAEGLVRKLEGMLSA